MRHKCPQCGDKFWTQGGLESHTALHDIRQRYARQYRDYQLNRTTRTTAAPETSPPTVIPPPTYDSAPPLTQDWNLNGVPDLMEPSSTPDPEPSREFGGGGGGDFGGGGDSGSWDSSSSDSSSSYDSGSSSDSSSSSSD